MPFVPPWIFIILHVVQSFHLEKAWGNWYGPTAQYIATAFHIMFATAEHKMFAVPLFDDLVYGYNLFALAALEFLSFMYLAYLNDASGKGGVPRWIALFGVWVLFGKSIGLGPPDPLTPEQGEKLFGTNFQYAIGHFVGHCVFALCFSSIYADVFPNESDKKDVEKGDLKVKDESKKDGRKSNKTKKVVSPPNTGYVVQYVTGKLAGASKITSNNPVIASVSACILAGLMSVAISYWDNFTVVFESEIPFFPREWCQAPLEANDECTLFGFTIPCNKAFSSETVRYFGFGLEMSHIFTFLASFGIGAFYMWSAPTGSGRGGWSYEVLMANSLLVTTALYAIETSFFALFRKFWGLSLPLVVSAAVHNLFEWSIVIHVWDFEGGHDALFKRLILAALFISTVIVICTCIPNLFLSLATEQLFGAVLDFALPMMFLWQLGSGDEERFKMYLEPAAAHTIHLFGTILPLVFSIILSGNVSWFINFFLEISIHLTVPATHFLYCRWARRLSNERMKGLAKATADESVKEPKPNSREDAVVPLFTEEATVNGSRTKPEDALPKSGRLPGGLRIKHIPYYLISGFVLGLILLGVGPSVLMGKCSEDCSTKSFIAITSVISSHNTVDEAKISEVPHKASVIHQLRTNNTGLIDIDIGYARHGVSPKGFFVVQKWEKEELVNKDFLDNCTDATCRSLVQWKHDMSPAVSKVEAATCPSRRFGVTTHIVPRSCKSVWKVLGNPEYCAWVPGCRMMQKGSAASHANLLLDNGEVIGAAVLRKKKDMRIELSIMGTAHLRGYSADISLESKTKSYFKRLLDKSECKIKYTYRRPMKDVPMGQCNRVRTFLERFVPDLYDQLEVPVKPQRKNDVKV